VEFTVDVSNEEMFEHLVSDDAKYLLSEIKQSLKQKNLETWQVMDFIYNIKALAAYLQLVEHYAIPEDQVKWFKEMLE